jgi:hypothetical protein
LSGSTWCCPLDVTRPNRPGSVCTQPYIECVFEDHLAELDAARTLTAAEANEHTLITAETRRLQIAAHWADLHPGEAVAANRLPGTQRPVRLGGEGTPTIGDFAAAELGCALRMSAGSASRLIGDALDLRHRLRLTCAVAQAGQVPAYQARHIATATRHLSFEQTASVDQQLAPTLGAVPWSRLQTLLEAAIYEADPAAAEQQAAAAAQQRFVRLGRTSEHGLKLIIARATAGDAIWFKAAVDRIADILGLCSSQRRWPSPPVPVSPARGCRAGAAGSAPQPPRGRCSISLKPVIDPPAGQTPVDSYEIPASLREQVLLRNPADVFPYAAAVSRSIDIDHAIPYLSPDRGGPPGQTRIGNLGPHIRRHHRLNTHGGWQVRQPEPGTWLWRSPQHRIYLVNASGTHPLGDTKFANATWCAAAVPLQKSAS